MKFLRLAVVKIFGSAVANPRFLTLIWVLSFLIPCSWAEASVLFLLKSKGKSSVLVASSLTRFEAAFRFRLPVLGFLRRFAVCVDQGELSVSAAADVRI